MIWLWKRKVYNYYLHGHLIIYRLLMLMLKVRKLALDEHSWKIMMWILHLLSTRTRGSTHANNWGATATLTSSVIHPSSLLRPRSRWVVTLQITLNLASYILLQQFYQLRACQRLSRYLKIYFTIDTYLFSLTSVIN